MVTIFYLRYVIDLSAFRPYTKKGTFRKRALIYAYDGVYTKHTIRMYREITRTYRCIKVWCNTSFL